MLNSSPCTNCDRGLEKKTNAFCLSCNGTGEYHEPAASITSNPSSRAKVKGTKAKGTKVAKKAVKKKK